MSLTTVRPELEEDIDVNDELSTLRAILKELRLLNERIEIAFETTITKEDI